MSGPISLRVLIDTTSLQAGLSATALGVADLLGSLSGRQILMWNGKWHAVMHCMRDIYRGTREAIMRPNADRDRIARFRKYLLGLGDYLRSN